MQEQPTPRVPSPTVGGIVFEWYGGQFEARVDETPVPRSRVIRGQLLVEHSSGDYAIYLGADGEFIANPIQEGI